CMASFLEKLKQGAEKNKSILCFGIDPVIENFPSSIKGSKKQKIIKFYSSIIDAAKPPSFSALKPNYAFFAQYGFDGLQALKKLIDKYKKKYPIILDAKRGDIGKTAAAYAKEGFEFWGADAITLSPLMGYDSIEPYFPYLDKGKGIYLLCRTSNAGAMDFLTLPLAHTNRPLYLSILSKCLAWHKNGMGVVAGATNISDLKQILEEIKYSNKNISILVPGVGSQGGSAKEVREVLNAYPSLLPFARINASSSIAYAYKNKNTNDYIGAALDEIEELNKYLTI
ncbi:MAG: orotidine-5'-phosphate decarboxylase, partial [Candidatus Micrarchaeota archaeon]